MDNVNNVLRVMIADARCGHAVSDIFDLMYETSLPYCELKDILDSLISQKEVECSDITSYKFIGDICREIEEEVAGNEECEPTDDDGMIEERLARLRSRRRELFRRMGDDQGISDEDAGATDESEETSCDYDYDAESDIFGDYDADGEEILHKNLIKILMDESWRGKLFAKALKLCVCEGYISENILSERLETDADTASDICIGLYLNDFIEKYDEVDGYKLCVSEELFLSCCAEADERKKSICGLSVAIKSIAAQRQAEEETNKLRDIILSDTSLNRTEAIIKAEGCLMAVVDAGNEVYAAIYKNIIDRLKNMSDYVFNRLKKTV